MPSAASNEQRAASDSAQRILTYGGARPLARGGGRRFIDTSFLTELNMTHEPTAPVPAPAVASSDADVEFVVERTFDAPRDLVFRAWTEPDRLAAWFGPRGMPTRTARFDLRPGGTYLYAMAVPGGAEWWGRWVFREVVPPERVAFVASFSDPEGGVTRAPFAADWPLETLSTVTFAEHAGRTTVTMRGLPINATEAERQAFKAGHASMTQGWGGTLDQLAGYLATA
ncbi:MAG: activator of Hsp90 ATPase 1 family protein [Phycisphaerales bacterium]|nr:activator of Hsp90 ATPase 1 family protein [Phycisphaerales bacterium]